MKDVEGRVIKSTGSQFLIRLMDGEVLNCSIKGKFRIKGIRATNPVAVGDLVLAEWSGEKNDPGVIKQIRERSNYIIRRSSKLSREYQLLAANVDQALLMVSLAAPRTLTAFMDRFLVSAEAYRIPVLILFNKIDLYGGDESAEMQYLMKIYREAGYACLPLSLQDRSGLDEVRQAMSGKINVISGNSGVGKSTLVQMLDPSIRLRTAEVSESHQTGKHTTTFAELFELEGGISIIDTPGIRGFGTIDIEKEELFHFFPEIFRESKNCKYHNCIHLHEPGCAVKDALEQGRISESRYINYLMIMEGKEEKYR